MTAEDFTRDVLPLRHKIFRFARRLMRGPVEAEDITQDVFAKLWTRKDSLGQYRSLEALAMTMTRNLCFDTLRSARNKTAELEDTDATSNEASPSQQAELADSVAMMQQLVDKLPEKQRMIIQLRDVEGYELAEIEEITGMKNNAIKVNLSRARHKIREQLKQAFEYGIDTH